MPRLGEMLTEVPDGVIRCPEGAEDIEVTGVHHDSRTVRKNGLFVALRGCARDGQDFIPQAERNGAAAVASDRPDGIREAVWLRADDPRRALAHLSAAYYGHPSRGMTLVGATGTTGKTSVCWFLRDAWNAMGRPSAALGTLGVTTGDPEAASWLGPVPWPTLTTPEATDLQATLAKLQRAGIEHVAMEVSSHALALRRTLTTHFRAVIFTNLGRDHLDFHKSEEAYRNAKLTLFSAAGRDAVSEQPPAAVVNVDDAVGRDLVENLLGPGPRPAGAPAGLQGLNGAPVLSFGLNAENDPWLRGTVLDANASGTAFRAQWPGGGGHFHVPLLGSFNASHVLAVMGTLLALGVSGEEAVPAISKVRGVPGRMEAIGDDRDTLVIVDFAHTPEALETVLRECRSLTENRVVVVFGCGGDRDRGKRPMMGLVAGQLADEVIVTTDNPRSEEPARIAEEIVEGLAAASARFEIVLDREKALARGLAAAGVGDVLLVAGRGAEPDQIIGDRRVPFDDRDVLRRLMGKTG